MNLDNKTIAALSKKFAYQFVNRMPSAAHLRADLTQEAAIAIWSVAARWTKSGGANLETFTRIYAWRAMQELCTKQSGPVSKPMVNGKYEGTGYAITLDPHSQTPVLGTNSHEIFERSGQLTPESALDLKDADEIVRDFIDRRTANISGNGKLSIDTIKNMLQDYLSGDSGPEVGKRYGCSKQRVHQLVAEAEIA